jgi:hypothetical protein
MSFAEFRRSAASDAAPPAGAGLPLQALWYDARGDWDRAHTAAQEDHGRDGAWVHAYLHRKEGDTGNAAYWYARARRPVVGPEVPLETEWAEIARALLPNE